MPTADISGVSISYTDTGGDGPLVMFSHGFLMDQSMFDSQAAALAPEFRVVTWDARGFGDTRASGPFTFWDSAADVLGLLDHLGARQAVLAGMSQGGFVSLRAALMAPERVRALVLIDTQSGTEDPAVAPGYEDLHQIWLAQGPGPVQEIISAIILGPGEWPDWYAKWAAADNEQFTRAFRCLMDRDDITGRIGEITCPALVVHGTADAAIPMARAKELSEVLGGPTELVSIDGGCHASNLTHPEPVNAAILTFLRGLDASPA